MDNAALNKLADAAGIEADYWDIEGRLHPRSPETARQLLCAMGIPAGSDAEIAASLMMLDEEPWREILPPVIFAAEGREVEVAIRLPINLITQRLCWSIDLESGGQASGECNLEAIPIEATGEISGSLIALRRMRLPSLPLGYHRLHLEVANGATASLIVTPTKCYLPPIDRAQKYWGVAAQLYSIKSQTNWGIGDFADLRALIGWLATRGADAIGLNPLHALFLDAPQDASPYSPNSRLFLNPLYLDVTAIADFAESAEARSFVESFGMSDAIQSARTADLIDYPTIATAKLAALEHLYRHFMTKHGDEADSRNRAFRKFMEERGNDLRHFATFQQLREHFMTHDWTRWPDTCHDPASDEVAQLARAGEQRLSFFQYLQWQCDVQFSAAAEQTRASGMRLGLYRDLAVSVDAASAEHWANRELFMCGARVGAPPDPFNEMGQDWGLVALNPRRLRATGYAYFISLLRCNMRHAGALRIDHVMGWRRLFVIPAGIPSARGAYVGFPLEDLLSIAALESERSQCVVIGEDLGTVPDGFRERMADANVLSTRIFYFERGHERFCRPAELPRLASVSAATHDLATLHGYWTADDIAAKVRLGIISSVDEERQSLSERSRDKQLLLQALANEGLLPGGVDVANSDHVAWMPQLADAIHAYLARSPCLLLIVQLDDLANQLQQPNLPGTTTEYPNWRRRLDRSLTELVGDTEVQKTIEAIVRERGR